MSKKPSRAQRKRTKGEEPKPKGPRLTPQEQYARQKEEEIETLRRQYGYLRMAPSALDSSFDTGNEIYSYSDSLAFAEFSDEEREQMWKKPQGMILIVLSAIFPAWLLFSFIYRMVTEANKGSVALDMLPSFFVIGVAVAIMLISAFGKWGSFLRFVFRHNLARPRDAFSRRNMQALMEDYNRVDENKRREMSVSVRQRAVVFTLAGEQYVFPREKVQVRVKLVNGALALDFSIDGLTLDFPVHLPKKEYAPLKRAFRERMNTVREGKAVEREHDDKGKRLYGGYTLGSVCTGTFFALVILAAAIMLIVAHYLWLPSLPPFVGIFFVGAAGLALCNTYGHIPVVNEVLLPLIFSLILTAIPFWANLWIETEVFGNAFTFVYVVTHCTPYGAGFTFLMSMGIYGIIFSVEKAIEYARFGSEK